MPPTIPTSFIPHPAGSPQQRYKADFAGALSLVAYLILLLTVFAAVGVFFYGRILNAELSAKDAALAKAESAIDPATVASFVHLRDRLVSGESLLNSHVALSGLFAALENLLPASVRFSSLHVLVDQKNGVMLRGGGVARSFNALAAASAAFSSDGRIKDAIFSNITVVPDGSVTFVLTATLDPKLIAFLPIAAAAGAAAMGATTP
ncbi:hypothetical protein HY091_00595 [Candidatus Kaiserbacteria bacterium]|nr:hypothetical protein [Candidatus Kaiserbacteria bacterium]